MAHCIAMISAIHRLQAHGLRLEEWVRQHRWPLRYRRTKRIRDRWLEISGPPNSVDEIQRAHSDKKRCLLDIRSIAIDGEQGRRFHALVMMLDRGGYEISLVPRLSFMQTANRVFKTQALNRVRPFELPSQTPSQTPSQPLFDLCLSDHQDSHRLAKRTVRLISQRSRPLSSGDLSLPYSFHPGVWQRCEDDQLVEYRTQERTSRLFFGGHCTKQAYAGIRQYPHLSVVDRHDVIELVRDQLGDSIIDIDSQTQLELVLQQRHESMVMIDNAHFRTEASQWMPLLASADFFMAAPGADYPLSHNAIESMAVGTIPVLEYESLFRPALTDGENCIAYQGREGLRDAIKRVMAMSQEQIQRLRSQVIEYYEGQISPNSFCDRLVQPSTKRLHPFSYLTPQSKTIGPARSIRMELALADGRPMTPFIGSESQQTSTS